ITHSPPRSTLFPYTTLFRSQNLDESRFELERERESLDRAIAEAATRLEDMRRELHAAETRWDESRTLLDSWKDRHNALEIEKTRSEEHTSELQSPYDLVCRL